MSELNPLLNQLLGSLHRATCTAQGDGQQGLTGATGVSVASQVLYAQTCAAATGNGSTNHQ